MTVSLKKTGAIAFTIAAAVSVSIELIGRGLDALNIHAGMWLSTVVIYIWPTGLALIGTSNDWASYIMFFVSVVMNGLSYALVAVLAHYCILIVKNWDPSS
jgi:hypothetical protein